jgi:hypothetical protein
MAAAARDAGADPARRRRARTVARHPQAQTEGAAKSEGIVNAPINIRRGELKRALLAQGASKLEVHNMVEDILAERSRWTAAALGRRIGLTFAVAIRERIRTSLQVDRTKMRATTARADEMSPTARQLYAVLNGDWIQASALVELMRCRDRKQKRDSLRRAKATTNFAFLETISRNSRIEAAPAIPAKGGAS